MFFYMLGDTKNFTEKNRKKCKLFQQTLEYVLLRSKQNSNFTDFPEGYLTNIE